MTEQEYIYVRDLSNVLVARDCLRNLNPGFSVMAKEETEKVQRELLKWEQALFKKIEDNKKE